MQQKVHVIPKLTQQMKHYRQNNVEEYVSVLAQLDRAFRNLQLLQQRGLQ